jgi:hypothetical protein
MVTPRRAVERHLALSGLLAFALVAGIARVGNYEAPVIGDLGQFLYVGDVVAHGGAPYVDAAFNKGPLTALLFAVIAPLADSSTTVVRLSAVPFAAVTALSLAAYVARYAGRRAGAFAGFAYAAFSAMQRLEGAEGKTETYAVAPLFAALWAATRPSRWAAAGAGALAGLAVLINPGFAVLAPAVAVQLWLAAPRGARVGRLGAAAAGLAAPVAAACAWLLAVGAFDDMLIQVGRQVRFALGLGQAGATGGPPLAAALVSQSVLGVPAAALWLPGLAGCALALRDRALRIPAAVLGLLLIAAVVRVKAAGYAADYQYYPAVPALCGEIALGLASVAALRRPRRALLAAVVLAPALWTLAVHPQLHLLGRSPVDRLPAGREVRSLGEFLRAHTTPRDRIFVSGGRAEVYWVAHRRAPTRFFDSFGPVNRPAYFAERRRTLARRPPRAIVVTSSEFVSKLTYLRPLIASGRYVQAYHRRGAHVWLRRP